MRNEISHFVLNDIVLKIVEKLIKVITSLFLTNRYFYGLGVIATLFVVGFIVPLFFTVAQVLLLMLAILTLVEIIILYRTSKGITLERELPERLSNGDKNKITLALKNEYNFEVKLNLIEELPYQFQKRDFVFSQQLKKKAKKTIYYDVTPVERGIYLFGKVNVFTSSLLFLAARKYSLGQETSLKCYASFLRLQEFDVNIAKSSALAYGTKKVRRIGNSMEFEQIKEYVSGDDIRTLNWKATAKRGELMVNQYIEEKSQAVYVIIDKGRAMQMVFEKLTLLDYAVNATLAISNIVLKKQDKAGMLTFSKKIEDWVVAERRNSQMSLISEGLYNIKTDFSESDFGVLYNIVKRKITHRSLLILFSNFETMDGLQRQLPYLRALAKNHLLLIVFFKNTELDKLTTKKAETIQEVYDTIIAEKFMFEKKKIVKELQKYGIQTLLTSPKELTGKTISKYLNLKAKGLF